MENPTLVCGPHNVRKSEICRLCMKSHEYYLNIFVINEEFTTSIDKTIEDLLVLKVAKGDNLPEMMCCPCVTKLMEFREFKEMCMNSAREFGRHAPKEPITCPVKDEFLHMHLLCEETSGTRSYCVDGESLVPVGLNDLSMDPFALENRTDTKEEYPRDPLGDSDDCGEEDFAETHCNEDASVCSESKPILMDDQGEVKKELELTEVVGKVESHSREVIDEGDSSDTGGPILLSDILAVMGMVDRCNYNGGVAEEEEKDSDNFGADRHGTSRNKVLNNLSCDPVCEENLYLEHSTVNSFVVDGFPQKRVKKPKNVKYYASSKKCSQLNDRTRSVRSHEREQLHYQAENTSYPTYYVCNYCSTRYLEKKSLALHIKRHVDGKRSESILPKKECPPRFSQNPLVKDRGNVEPVIFETRNISFAQKSSRHQHENPTVCDLRGKNLKNAETLKKPSVNLTGSKLFKCNECGKIFTEKPNLIRHSRIHSGVKPFKCNECGKMFPQKRYLIAHSVVHTGVKRFKCNECGKMFTHKYCLKKHSRIRSGVKSFNCNDCGKIFCTRSDISRHLVVHTGWKRFKCNECGKMFSTKTGVRRHLVVHTGVKSFKCNDCGKMFNQSFNLRTHSRIHSGVKPFKCNECGKMFTRRSDLKIHSVLHTGVMPFKCEFCGKQFKWRASFKRHLLTHSDRNPLK